MIEREKFIKRKRKIKEWFCCCFVCLGQKFSKPTQMFSVSVLKIFLDTKINFTWYHFGQPIWVFFYFRGFEEYQRKKNSSNTFHKGQIKFFSFFSFSLNITIVSAAFYFMSIFMSDFFQCFILSFSFLFSGRFFFLFNK